MKTPYTITSGGAVSIKAIDALRHPDVQAELAKVRRLRESHPGLAANELQEKLLREARLAASPLQRKLCEAAAEGMRMLSARAKATGEQS